MKCREVKSLMFDWLDELLPERQREVQTHLDSCITCRCHVQEMKQVLTALSKLKRPVPVPPPEFTAQVMGRLKMESLKKEEKIMGQPHLFRIPLRSLALAASILLLFGINSIILSSYGAGGLIQRMFAPFTDSAAVVDRPATNPGEGKPLPQEPAVGEGVTSEPAEEPAAQPTQPESLPTVIPAEQPAVTAVAERQKPVVAPRKKEPSENMVKQVVTPQNRAVAEIKAGAVAPLSWQPKQVNIPEPHIFLNRRRVTESTVVRINVQQLTMASQALIANASTQGATAIMEDTILAHDGRLIRVYQFEVPFMQANRFVAGTTLLGNLLAEKQVHADITNDYANKLARYEQAVRQRSDASGEEAARLNQTINELLSEMSALDRSTRTTQKVIVWLES